MGYSGKCIERASCAIEPGPDLAPGAEWGKGGCARGKSKGKGKGLGAGPEKRADTAPKCYEFAVAALDEAGRSSWIASLTAARVLPAAPLADQGYKYASSSGVLRMRVDLSGAVPAMSEGGRVRREEKEGEL